MNISLLPSRLAKRAPETIADAATSPADEAGAAAAATLASLSSAPSESEAMTIDVDDAKAGVATSAAPPAEPPAAPGAADDAITISLSDVRPSPKWSSAEELAQSYTRRELQDLAAQHDVAQTGKKMEIAERLMGLAEFAGAPAAP